VTDRDALYAAVLAAPDDDTPRLVYADYLDDTGVRAAGIRARFIRNQVALARAEPWSAEYDDLQRATAPVERHYSREWAGVVVGDAGPVRFDRGFVGHLACKAGWFVEHGPRLFASHPVRQLTVDDLYAPEEWDAALELIECPALGRLRGLELIGRLVNDDFARRMADSPHLSGLTRLRLEATSLTPVGYAALLSGPLPALSDFEIASSLGQGAIEVESVARTPGATRLSVLGLSDNAQRPALARVLAAAESFSGLHTLRVVAGNFSGVNTLGVGGVRTLARSPHLRALTELDLRWQGLRDGGIFRFAEVYGWDGMTRLNLRGNRLTATAVTAFVQNPAMRSLRELDLRLNHIRVTDLDPLREALPQTRIRAEDVDPTPPMTLAPEDEP
jgi:uncharacterized protein (TIGR02996 family)